MSDHQIIRGVWRTSSDTNRGFTIPVSETMFGAKLLYQLNPDAHPKQIDLEHRRPRGRPRASAKGIYSLEGDTLKVCWVYDGARPTEFKNDPESEQRLLVLKRVAAEKVG